MNENTNCQEIRRIFRKGDASKPIDIVPFVIKGNLSAVTNFLEKRGSLISYKDSFIYVSKDTIELVLFDNLSIKSSVSGKITFDEPLDVFMKDIYTPESLGIWLRTHPYYWANPANIRETIAKLLNFNVKLDQEIEKQKDFRGNNANSFKQTIAQSNLPNGFQLYYNLNGEKKIVDIEIILNSNISLSLYSESLYILKENDAEKIIQNEITKIIKLKPDLPIIYK